MGRKLWVSAVLLLAVAAGGLVFWWPSRQEVPAVLLDPGDAALVARGAEVYAEACASCHGADLSGEPGWPDWRRRKPDGRLAAPPHDASGHTWHHPDRVLFDITKYGPAAVSDDPDYVSDMPAFEDELSDRDIAAALSYIKSTWRGDVKAANERINRQVAGE